MTLPRKLLVATDFEACGDRAVDVALDWAACLDAEVHFVHVVEQLSDAATPSGEPLIVGYLEQARRHAKQRLGELEARASDRGLRADSHVPEGDAVAAVVALAESLGADCILVGSHGRTGLAHLWFGSVAEGIVRGAGCSVLIVRGDRAAGRGETLLLGEDLTPRSTAARRLALALAPALDAEVVAVHSLELGIPYLSSVEVVVPNRLFDEAFERAQEQLEELARETPGIAIENVVVSDRPAHELCVRSEADEVGLVVVGCDPTTRLNRLLLGTVAERVVRHAACSVLVVREPS